MGGLDIEDWEIFGHPPSEPIRRPAVGSEFSSLHPVLHQFEVGNRHPIEGIWRGPSSGDSYSVTIGEVFNLYTYPMGLADRPWIALAVLDPDVAATVIFGNAELGGLGGGHEIKGARQANGGEHGGGAARVVDGGITFAGRQFA